MSTPTITPSAGTYPAGTAVTIYPAKAGETIYFTLDGTPPSPKNKRYRGPIRLEPETTLNGVMRLRAISLSSHGRCSPVAAADFHRATGIRIRFRKPDAWSSAFAYVWGTEPDGLATPWPGWPMRPQTGGWYITDLPQRTRTNVVFSDAGGAQSADFSVNTPDLWCVDGECWGVDPTRLSGYLFPGGASKALVVSMDDGPVQDRRLVELLERCGIRGTFHLCSGRFGQPESVCAEEIASLYAGHEIATHTIDHPYLTALSADDIKVQVGGDRDRLSSILGRTVRGHAYPFGAYDTEVVRVLRELDIVYARTASPTHDFRLPGDRLVWHPSCHHTAAGELASAFLASPSDKLALLFIFGHSWELDAGAPTNSWDYMASLARQLGNRQDIWYATAIELADYLDALYAARPSLNDDSLVNPSDTDLWLRQGNRIVRLPAQARVPGLLDADY